MKLPFSSFSSRRHAAGYLIPGGIRGWIFASALIFFACSLSPHPFPGESARQIVIHTRAFPFPPMADPLWQIIVRALELVPLGTLAFRLNSFSALLGAWTILLFFDLCRNPQLILHHTAPDSRAGLISGLASAGFLVVSGPFWWISTRAHPAGLDIFLLVASLRALQLYHRQGRLICILAFMFLYSVGTMECPLLILLGPPVALIAVLALARRRDLKARTLVPAIGAVAAGLTLCLVAVRQFSASPAFQWRGFSSSGQVLAYFAREQWLTSLASIPRQGWMLIAVITLLPWALLWVVAQRRSRRRWPHLVCTALVLFTGVLILYEAPIAPAAWYPRDSAPVLPYLLIASCFGLGCGLGCHFFERRWSSRFSSGVLHTAPAAALALLFAGAAAVRYPDMNARQGSPVYRCARETVRAMGDATFLVTRSPLDDLILLAARERRHPLHLIDPYQGDHPVYQKYLESLFPDPRLRSLAMAGPLALLNEWIRTDPKIESHLALHLAPELWRQGGYLPVPHRTVFQGRRDKEQIHAQDVFAENEFFWNTHVESLRGLLDRVDAAGVGARYLIEQSSRMANDTGVLIEQLDRPDLAERAYRRGLRLQPQNLSAALNLTVLLEQLQRTAEAEQFWTNVEKQLDPRYRGTPPAVWSARYGFIAQSEALRKWSDLWAVSEPPATLQEGWREGFRLYAAGQPREALREFDRLVQEHPREKTAWILRGVLAYELGEETTLNQCLDQMKESEEEWAPFLMILGERAVASNQNEEAAKYLNRAHQLWPLNIRILEALVRFELHVNDRSALEQHLRWLLAIDPGNAWGNYALGLIHFEQGAWDLSETALLRAVGRTPLPLAFNNLAWMLQLRGRNEDALMYAQEAVKLEPYGYALWDTLGVVLANLDRYDAAEEALSRARQLHPGGAEAILHLADLALHRGQKDKALEWLARPEVNPDTLAPDDLALRSRLAAEAAGEITIP